jgi:hypothetical protein
VRVAGEGGELFILGFEQWEAAKEIPTAGRLLGVGGGGKVWFGEEGGGLVVVGEGGGVVRVEGGGEGFEVEQANFFGNEVAIVYKEVGEVAQPIYKVGAVTIGGGEGRGGGGGEEAVQVTDLLSYCGFGDVSASEKLMKDRGDAWGLVTSWRTEGGKVRVEYKSWGGDDFRERVKVDVEGWGGGAVSDDWLCVGDGCVFLIGAAERGGAGGDGGEGGEVDKLIIAVQARFS